MPKVKVRKEKNLLVSEVESKEADEPLDQTDVIASYCNALCVLISRFRTSLIMISRAFKSDVDSRFRQSGNPISEVTTSCVTVSVMLLRKRSPLIRAILW